jgi:peroxiredoxin Q/BCP
MGIFSEEVTGTLSWAMSRKPSAPGGATAPSAKEAKPLGKDLRVGDLAPDFEAKDQQGRTRKLAEHRGKWVLLYFYPKDDTPGCTRQACDLRDQYAEFTQAGVVIYGVSRQDAASHEAFRKKHRLPFDLLVDEDGSLGALYGVGSFFGFGFFNRESVLVSPEGKIAALLRSVDPETHASEVLSLVRGAPAASR